MPLVNSNSYPEIPVSLHRERIIEAIHKHKIIVVVGDTGSGKTTQLPKMALEYVQSLKEGERGLVGCTQPRRIAAASVSKRVATELNVEAGVEVGYQVRFEDQTSKETQLKFMTDGILLAETQGDPLLKKYSVIIIDEAHERSLNIDFLLGYLKRLADSRDDIRVIISSATLDAGAFSEFFQNAPIIEVEGRTFPVETHYFPASEDIRDLSQHVIEAVQWIRSLDQQGDVLIFLAGEREIRECADVLESQYFSNTEVLPLFARLGLSEQQKVFRTVPGRQRIVLATNVAETSLTIPGIVYVIDSGLARVNRWNPSRQVQRLQVEKISQASARQRKGRCGRVKEGVCVRLYDEEDHDARSEYTDPEIRRSSLAGVILRMKMLKLPEIEEFPFIDPPSSKHTSEGYRTLREIGAIDKENQMQRRGYQLAKLPVEPRLGRMILESEQRNCMAELLVIVSGLSIMDPRERPQEKQQQADQAHAKWKHAESDFLSLLLLWSDLQKFRDGRHFQKNKLRRFCGKEYLNFRRVLEWDNLHNELVRLSKNGLKFKVNPLDSVQANWAHEDEIHKAILSGIPKQIGVFDREKKSYKGAQSKEFSLFPGSNLAGKKKLEWVLAYEMVDTSRLFARRNAKLNPKWVEEVAPHLCSMRWHSAEFDVNQGVVFAKEIVSIASLTLVPSRNVHYGRINPEAAREVFILDGLLKNKLKSKPALLNKVEELREEVRGIEQKLRRVDGIWSEELVADWFREHLPEEICTAKAFTKWTRDQPKEISLQDLIYDDINELRLEGFPDWLEHDGVSYPLYYKAEPEDFDDGVTVEIHIDQLVHFPDFLPSWGVYGELEERVSILIRTLPKALRIACNPIAEKAQIFVKQWDGVALVCELHTALAYFLSEMIGQRVTADSFDLKKLPDAMEMKFWVADDEGNELAFDNSLDRVKQKLASLTKDRFEESSNAEWEFTGMTSFECDELPISFESQQREAFPALIDEGQTVGVKVFADKLVANNEHRSGVIRLFLLQYADHAKYVVKNLPLSVEAKMYLPVLGEKGVDLSQVLRWSVECAMGKSLPRDSAMFEKVAENARGVLHDAAGTVCNFLDKIISQFREIEMLLVGWKNDENLAEVAEDIDEQLRWLLRAEFSEQVSVADLQNYVVWFSAIIERMQRAKSAPLIKDLEKMDKILERWQPWHDRWLERKNDLALIDLGNALNNLRSSYFSPNTKLFQKASEKQIDLKMEQLGLRN